MLDTATLLFLARDRGRVSAAARNVIEDARTKLWLSAISSWEINVKWSRGKLDLPTSPGNFVMRIRAEYGIDQVELREADLVPLERLPWHHRDPFDRALVSVSIARGFILLTPDVTIRRYEAATILW